jgi:hypothetical protein
MSWLRECALLGDRGCTLGLDERPSGGAHYVPQFVHGTRQCYMPVSVMGLWKPYQSLLAKLEEYLLAI